MQRSRVLPATVRAVPVTCNEIQHLTGSTAELHAAVDALNADTVPESYYQKVLASRAGHSRGTWPQSATVANGHERSIAPQVNGHMAPSVMLEVEEVIAIC